MQAGELHDLHPGVWDEIEAGEHQPWGGLGEEMEWVEKDRHVGIHDDQGRLVAMAGVLVAPIAVQGYGEFPVVGVGGVIVTHSRRGEGMARLVLEETLRISEEMGPQRAMLFCRPQLMALYGRFGFAAIEAPVVAEQPAGPVEMPLAAMWRPLTADVGWPPGDVRVLGLPF